MASNYTEVRLVFDRYISDLLKAHTRRKLTSRKKFRYKILDSTNISLISSKSLLSHIDTKQDLTVYLARKSKSGFEAVSQQYIVTYDRISESNMESFPDVMKTHNHEEADMLLILHCFNIERRDPFTTCTVYSPDTDVFLFLIHFYPPFPQACFTLERKKTQERSTLDRFMKVLVQVMPKPCWCFTFLLAATRWAASQRSQKHFGGKNFKDQIRTH